MVCNQITTNKSVDWAIMNVTLKQHFFGSVAWKLRKTSAKKAKYIAVHKIMPNIFPQFPNCAGTGISVHLVISRCITFNVFFKLWASQSICFFVIKEIMGCHASITKNALVRGVITVAHPDHEIDVNDIVIPWMLCNMAFLQQACRSNTPPDRMACIA